jgi:DNA-binding response OmpR family regulator
MLMRIFLAEPDAHEKEAIREVLLRAGYEVKLAKQGEDLAEPADCTAMILAIESPWGDALEVVRRLQENCCTLPVLLLASKDESDRGALGLDVGADDFLVKPVSGHELLARLRARLRCRVSERKRILRVEDLELHTASRRVSRNGQRIDLPGCPALLHTVRGVGFVLRKQAV